MNKIIKMIWENGKEEENIIKDFDKDIGITIETSTGFRILCIQHPQIAKKKKEITIDMNETQFNTIMNWLVPTIESGILIEKEYNELLDRLYGVQHRSIFSHKYTNDDCAFI